MALTDSKLSQYKSKLGQLKNLLDDGFAMHEELVKKKTLTGEVLTSTQVSNIRGKYSSWKTNLQSWFTGLP